MIHLLTADPGTTTWAAASISIAAIIGLCFIVWVMFR